VKKLLGLVAAAVILSGCTIISADGGGWMPGAENGKASFGFDIWCNYATDRLNGTWVYQDKKSGINAHGTLTDTGGGWIKPFFGSPYETGLHCSPQFGSYDSEAGLHLVYQTRSCGHGVCDSGFAYVRLDDDGQQGPDKGDELKVEFWTGPYAGYENWGTLLGGQLTVDSF
jgi:hypothetical protein